MNNTDSKRSIGCAADQENIFAAKETPFLDTSIDAGDLFQAAPSMAYLRHLLKVFHIPRGAFVCHVPRVEVVILYFYVHLIMSIMFMRPVTLPSFKPSNVRLKFCSSVSANHLNPTFAALLDINHRFQKSANQAHKNLPSAYFFP